MVTAWYCSRQRGFRTAPFIVPFSEKSNSSAWGAESSQPRNMDSPGTL